MEKEQIQIENVQNHVEGDDKEKKNHKKGEKKQKQKKEYKSEYVFDADKITIETEIPSLPKKNQILPQPKFDDFKEKEKKNKEKIIQMIQKKKQIRNQNYKAQQAAKKGEQNKHGSFKNEIQQAKQLRERFNEVKKQRNDLRDKLHKLIDQAKQNNATIKELGGKANTSKQSILERLEKLEHKLTTDTLSKDDEKNLNNEIMLLKRKTKDAESVGNIQFKIAKAQERKSQLDHLIEQVKVQKQPFEKEYTELKQALDKKNANIDGLKKDLETDNKQRQTRKQQSNKQYEKWKENKKKRLDEIEQRIKKTHEDNDKLWAEFNEKKQAYWKQKHYIDWIEWQMRMKNKKIKDIEWEKKRQQYENQDKEREKQENMSKYIGEIELCNFLIQYLNNIREEYNKANNNNKNNSKETVDVTVKLTENSEWKKEKGLELLKSKKSRQDEEAPRKAGKKNKKRVEQKKQEFAFNIPYNVQNQFESLKVLAPSSIQEIEKKIFELKDRQLLFVRNCQTEGVSEEDIKLLEEIKNKKSSNKPAVQKKVQVEDDFPTL